MFGAVVQPAKGRPPVGQRACATGIKGSTWVHGFSAHQTPLSQSQYAPPVQAIARGGRALEAWQLAALGPESSWVLRLPAAGGLQLPQPGDGSLQPSQRRPARACPELGSAERADATERLPGESCRQVFSW